MTRRKVLGRLVLVTLGAAAPPLLLGCDSGTGGVSQAEPRKEEDIRKLYGGGPAGGPDGPEAKKAAKKAK